MEFNVDLKYMTYITKCTLKFKNGSLFTAKVHEVTYKDEFGEFQVNKRTRTKIQGFFKNNVFGNPEEGIYFNRPFRIMLADLIPISED